MPTVTTGLSNENYKFVKKIMDARRCTFTQALNGLVDDSRARHYTKRVKNEADIREGRQLDLYELPR